MSGEGLHYFRVNAAASEIADEGVPHGMKVRHPPRVVPVDDVGSLKIGPEHICRVLAFRHRRKGQRAWQTENEVRLQFGCQSFPRG